MAWLDLSVDLWVSIYHRLDNVADRLFFGSVCSLFRSISSSIEDDPIRLSKALLLINPSPSNSQTHQFFSLTNTKLYSCSIPELQGKWLCGSSDGLLLTMDCQSGDMNLFNPLTRSQISLPPSYNQNYDYKLLFVGKFTMSNTADGFIVMAALTYQNGLHSLAFCQNGDTKWIFLQSKFYDVQDIMYYNGMFCVINSEGALVAWDINVYRKIINGEYTNGKSIFRTLRGCKEKPAFGILNNLDLQFYIVESLSGELLKICRLVDYDRRDKYNTCGFRVYKLDEFKNWIIVRRLGDQSLFLGNNQSICLSSLDHPEFQADCIYFTGDNGSPHGVNDMGVFSLKNYTIQPFYSNHPMWTNGCIWITPSMR